jgi:hypothetical protein
MLDILFNKTVNGPKLLSELYAQLGVVGATDQLSLYAIIAPSEVTQDQIQAVIAAHDPTPVPTPTQLSLAQLRSYFQTGFDNLTAAQQTDVLRQLLTVVSATQRMASAAAGVIS